MTEIRYAREADQSAVVMLWQRCGLIDDAGAAVADVTLKLQRQPELFWVAELDGRIIATVMAGFDGHRGWIYRLATDPDQQHAGHARTLMQQAEDALRALGCSKLNLQIRGDNETVKGFYEGLGFSEEDRISMGKRLTTSNAEP